MQSAYEIESATNRHVFVRHEDGHRWQFYFMEGYGGTDPQIVHGPEWANGVAPDDPSLSKSAAEFATEIAKQQGWI